MVHLRVASRCSVIISIRYPMVCSKWMSSTDAVIQEHPACLSAGRRREIITRNNTAIDIKGYDNDSLYTVMLENRVWSNNGFFKKMFKPELSMFPTRQTGRRVHPLQQLSHTQLPTVVGVTWQYDLTHLHLSGVPVPFHTRLDGDGALYRAWFIFGCHHSATHEKCNFVKAWFQVSERTLVAEYTTTFKHALVLWRV